MTVLAGIAALAMAAAVGYYLGRRAGSAPRTWTMRASRVTVGRVAINLLVLLAARRIRRGVRAEPMLVDAVHVWGPRVLAPLGLLRGTVARMRSY